MSALPVNQAVRSGQVLVERKILTQHSNWLDGFVIELRDRRDRHPVAPQQAAHGRARTHLGQQLILGLVQHPAKYKTLASFVLGFALDAASRYNPPLRGIMRTFTILSLVAALCALAAFTVVAQAP